MRGLRGFVFLLAFTAAISTSAQSNVECVETLNRAEAEFNAGHFYGIPSLLQNCLEQFTNEQKVRAYMLLCQSYLIIDDHIAAEDSYLRLLAADPEYVATPEVDPIDVVYLSKKFTATPVFTPHLRAGANASLFRLIQSDNTFPYEVSEKRSLLPRYQLGGGIDWNINDNISLAGELNYAYRSYRIATSGINKDNFQLFQENQSWIDVPLYFKFRQATGNIRPFGYAGAAVNLLVRATAPIRYENREITPQNNIESKATEDRDENLNYKRNFFNWSLIGGGGIYYKFGRDFIFADLRYSLGFTNLVKEEANHLDKEGRNIPLHTTKYQYVGDFYRQDVIMISLGYVRPLYNPRRLNKVRTQSVLRNVTDQ